MKNFFMSTSFKEILKKKKQWVELCLLEIYKTSVLKMKL